jgi:NAD(P)-dependent dehydrogenase (short-subunit alcohol dehydrogenase family)
MELAGKVALVTGAARGLGRAMALALGADVAVSDKTAMWTKVLNPLLSQTFEIPEERVFETFVERFTYLRRPKTAEEIAAAAVYLCRADNVTGITLTVAGGGEVH